jgi:4-alpha-glucanotransferase
LPLIAEDLGDITVEVQALRDRFELPGMKILQFAFSNSPGAEVYLPYSYPSHCLVYTGTHDNDTTLGWFTAPPPADPRAAEVVAEERDFIRRYTGTSGAEIHWDLIRLALSSVAATAIVPMQDILGLGSAARMNVPGLAEGNWAWRLRPGQFDAPARRRLAEMTASYGRWNGRVPPSLRPPRRPPNEEPFLGR